MKIHRKGSPENLDSALDGVGSNTLRTGAEGILNVLPSKSTQRANLSGKVQKIIKNTSSVVSAYEKAGRQSQSTALLLSRWGEKTDDEAVNALSDSVGIMINEIGASEETLAAQLEQARQLLKVLRNTEASIENSRNRRRKLEEEMNRMKNKNALDAHRHDLEQRDMRSKAENLVAEAQLANDTREKFKEAYQLYFAALTQRAEKQILISEAALCMLEQLQDINVLPGMKLPSFDGQETVRKLLHQCEERLNDWRIRRSTVETIVQEGKVVPKQTIDWKAETEKLLTTSNQRKSSEMNKQIANEQTS